MVHEGELRVSLQKASFRGIAELLVPSFSVFQLALPSSPSTRLFLLAPDLECRVGILTPCAAKCLDRVVGSVDGGDDSKLES